MDEGNEDYNLVLFGIAESFPEGLPPMKDIITYVEGCAHHEIPSRSPDARL